VGPLLKHNPGQMVTRERRLIEAVYRSTHKLAVTTSVEETLREVLHLCVEAVDASGGTIYIHDPVAKRLRFRHVLPEEVAERLPHKDIPDDFGIAGAVYQARRAMIGPVGASADRAAIEEATGFVVEEALTAPLMVEGMQPLGVVQLLNRRNADFDESDLQVIETVSAVSALAYINSLLTEQAARMASLEAMGKVSHDIGNLAASLHSHVLLLAPAIEEVSAGTDTAAYVREGFTSLAESIDRIVGYSRLISDLAAGRPLRPDLKPVRFSDTVREAVSYLEPEARRRGVTLTVTADVEEPTLLDPLYVFRIAQNLVGNALKAVHEAKGLGGRVEVRTFARDCMHVLEVQDDGPGMPDEVRERIVHGLAVSGWRKSGGSGWGTKIVSELAGALGGRIEVDSELGRGTTFRVLIPMTPIPAERRQGARA
jgi:signal transduction histidine kinase